MWFGVSGPGAVVAVKLLTWRISVCDPPPGSFQNARL